MATTVATVATMASAQPRKQAATTMARAGAIAAAATVTTVTRAIAIRVTAVTSNGFLFTAQEGDADDREKDRDTQKHSSIHPKLLEVSQST
jgi:hypothetical protein